MNEAYGNSHENEQNEPLIICSLDQFVEGMKYDIDPPLPIAIIHFISEHLTKQGRRRPTFLEEDIREAGMRSGVFVQKREFNGGKTGTFRCESRFFNNHTGKWEVVKYRAVCKFSNETADGIRAEVKRKVDETLGDSEKQ